MKKLALLIVLSATCLFTTACGGSTCEDAAEIFETECGGDDSFTITFDADACEGDDAGEKVADCIVEADGKGCSAVAACFDV